jgi:hypothetical protein
MHIQSYSCVLYVESIEDDICYLFFSYPFGPACWTYLGINWDTTLVFGLMVMKASIILESSLGR